MSTSYYQLLDLHPLSTSSDIEKAYKKQALLHHPDRNRDGDQQLATERFQRISEAYQTLKDPIRRMKYDAKLATRYPTRSTTDNTYFSTSNQRHSAPAPTFKPTRSTSTPNYDPSRTPRYSTASPTSSKKPPPQASTNEYIPQPSRSQSRPSSRPKPTFNASFDLPRTSTNKAQQTPHFEWFSQSQNPSSFEFPSNLKPRSKPTPIPDFPPTTTVPSHRTPLSSAYTKTPSVSNRPPKQANTFYANKSRASSKPISKETNSSSFFDIFSSKGSHSSKPPESRSSSSKPPFSKSPDDPDFITSAFAHLLSKSVPDPHPIKPIIPEIFKEQHPKFTSPSYHQDQFSRTSHKRDDFKTRPEYPIHQSYSQKNRDNFSQYIPTKPRPRSYSNTPNDSLNQWREKVAFNTMRYPQAEPLSMDEISSEGEELYGVNWPPIKPSTRSNPPRHKERDPSEDRYESLFPKTDPNHHPHLFDARHSSDHHRNPNENLNRRRRTFSASESVSVHFTHQHDRNSTTHHDGEKQLNQEWVRKEVRTFMVQNHW